MIGASDATGAERSSYKNFTVDTGIRRAIVGVAWQEEGSDIFISRLKLKKLNIDRYFKS